MRKDRPIEFSLDEKTRIIWERSSNHPVEYAVTLLVKHNGDWHTVRCFDNSHGTDIHHEHRYRGRDKQPPIVTEGDVNKAMHAVLVKLRTGWVDIVRSWEESL